MPSSSTNYSYDIPTVGSDSTTYGTIINQFVNSLSTKLKAVSDAINTAGVGASSTLAQVNRNIAQVDAINSRLPAGVADLLPDPYSGATTPVSTWPYLNTELQAEGFSPPTTAQEVLDFDYTGFANYLNTRFDSLSARIVGLDAPITIADSSTLVCETNKILNTIGEYKTVTTTSRTTQSVVTPLSTVSVFNVNNYGIALDQNRNTTTNDGGFRPAIKELFYPNDDVPSSYYIAFSSTSFGQGQYFTLGQTATLTFGNITARVSAGEVLDNGVYIQDSSNSGTTKIRFVANGFVRPEDNNYPNRFSSYQFVKVTNTTTTAETSTSVKKTIDDVDFSGCS